MTDEQINIAIAESLCWRNVRKDAPHNKPWDVPLGNSPHSTYSGLGFEKIPKYTSDLNACHEFEKTLDTREKWLKYINALWDLCGLSKYKLEHPPLIHAEPIQKCEAYLRTIGKWSDEKGGES